MLHWPEFLGDYNSALDNYWSALHDEPELQRNAERRCAQYPPLTATKIEIPGLRFPVTFRPLAGSPARMAARRSHRTRSQSLLK